MEKRIYIVLMATVIITAIYQLFSINYGCADRITYDTKQLTKNNTKYADEHLSVIYERMMDNVIDHIHLQIDTTYHQIGKGAYRHEIICNRNYTLHSFDGQYNNMQDGVLACFISGKDWKTDEDAHQRRIIGYECQRATTHIAGILYEAWYTNTLPHHLPNSKVIDDKCGLILEARNAEGNYILRAKYIGEQIG